MRRLVICFLSVFLALLVLAPPAAAAWLWPVSGEVITPYRNGADPYAAGQHRGIDIAAPIGTPVVAAAGGQILHSSTVGSSGLTVSVRTSEGVDTSYLHLSSVTVREGQTVAAGERLGAVGASGTRSAEVPHLHFGVRESGSRHAYRDPLAFLPPAPVGSPGSSPHSEPSPVPAPETPGVPAPGIAPAPGRVPAARREPARRPAPNTRRVPARPRVPAHPRVPAAAPAPARRHSPAPVRRATPTRGTAPAPGALPITASAPAHGRARADGRASDHGRATAHGRTPAGAPATSPGRLAASDPNPLEADRAAPARPAAPASSHDGPGLGFAFACAGLLMAAAILGLTEDGRKATRRGRSALGGALRPLIGALPHGRRPG